jgi:hypothetical protein
MALSRFTTRGTPAVCVPVDSAKHCTRRAERDLSKGRDRRSGCRHAKLLLAHYRLILFPGDVYSSADHRSSSVRDASDLDATIASS